MHRDVTVTPEERFELSRLYSDAKSRLERNPTGQGPLLSVEAYRLELSGDYDGAELLASKLAEKNRLEDLFRLWRLQLRGNDAIKLRKIADLAAQQLRTPGSRARDELLAPTLSFAVKALLKLNERRSAQQLLDRHKSELTSSQFWGVSKLFEADNHQEVDYMSAEA